MANGLNIFMTGILIAAFSVAATAAAKRPGSHWQYFHFDGRSFISGQTVDAGTFIAVKNSFKPQVLTQMSALEETELPDDNGAIVGFCYIQRSGGKLNLGASFQPSSHITVRISDNNRLVATPETDNRGYFVTILPPGRYQVSGRETIEVVIEKGKTILIPIRVGKRMVD
ncbi:MAG: hypothetical protein WCP33_01100 [Deltaproteobacteria bacterium]